MFKSYSITILLSFFWALSIAGLAQAGDDIFAGVSSNEDEFLAVEQAYQLHVESDNNQLTLVWTLAPKYFLYKHGFAHEIITSGNASSISVVLPKGIEKDDEYFGRVETYYDQVVISLPHSANKTDMPIFLKASSQGCADAGLCYPPYHQFFQINADDSVKAISEDKYDQQLIKKDSAINQAASTTTNDKTTNDVSFWLIIISAILGGMILNLMPCVFPVLSIKVLQLAKHKDSHKVHGMIYMLGVVLSFMAIAAIMLSLRAGGDAIGWGFQLQNPIVIASLTYLFFLLGLSMSGVFYIGQRWMGLGQELTQSGGKRGAFFTGVLAVVVATPCTAPFMGSALGYAISQPTYIALSVFAALGFGMALPLTLASFLPIVGKMLPKPGPWMENLKQFFAFPLYATCIWLLWVLGNQTSTTGMAAIMLGCLAIYMAIWCIQSQKAITKIIAGLLFITAAAIPFNSKLFDQARSDKPMQKDHIAFSQKTLSDYRDANQAVFIDLTADWCITCIANEKSTLETDEIQQAFKDADIVYMVGDWTNYNPEITDLLASYQRSGIPLYLLYPADKNAPAIILPQLLTKQIVLDAIEKVSKH